MNKLLECSRRMFTPNTTLLLRLCHKIPYVNINYI
nr:MAG TPA: hypothetical protein [Caudoviricetes sp.]